jgi:hypothetical protein
VKIFYPQLSIIDTIFWLRNVKIFYPQLSIIDTIFWLRNVKLSYPQLSIIDIMMMVLYFAHILFSWDRIFSHS